MMTRFALPLLALGLAGCQAYAPYPQGPFGYPEPIPYPLPADVMPGDYRAIGTEPFWDLTIGRDLVFNDRGNNISVAEPTPIVRRGPNGDFYPGRRLRVTIDRRPCSDGMSDRSYPDTVNVIVDGRAYRGCGAEAAFFARVGEDGRDKPVGEHDLSNTNWRVTAINGRPVPISGYYLYFDRERVTGRFGCNALGGNYRVTGSTLTTPALTATRMACPAMQDETQGLRVMGQPMTIVETGDRLTLNNRLGAIDLIRAR